MKSHTRRDVLRAAGVAGVTGVVGLAGCVEAARPTPSPAGTVTMAGSSTATATFRGGIRRLGYYPNASVPAEGGIDWELPGINVGDHTAAKASPVPAPDGDVVVAGDNGSVYRVTPAGEVVWAASTYPSGRGIHGTPTIANGAVYVGAYDGALYAFDLDSGDLVWRVELGGAIGSSPAYRDGTVYVAVEFLPRGGSLFAVDAAGGDVVWEGTAPTDHPHSTCAYDPGSGILAVGSNDGNLYGWTLDGDHRWTFETGDAIKGPVAAHDGGFVFGSWDAHVYRVAADSGDREWAYETDDMVMSGPAVDTRDGVVYVGSHDEHCYALDADSGRRIWRFDAGGMVVGCPTVTARRVLVGSYAGRLYCLQKGSGELDWSVATEGWVTCAPRVVDGAVYVTERATREDSGALFRIGSR